ncbi:predicted protein, partial [Nematostella vectensis]
YKPVIVLHGILDKASDMKDLAGFIRSAHPGTNITIVDMFSELKSFEPLWRQVRGISPKLRPIMEQAKDGVHMIGFSQGGITLRGIIETMPDHNVDTFIALSSPLMGQYGDTSYLNPFIPYKLRKDAYEFFYSRIAQDTLAIANYWNDPYHQKLNMEYNIFLPFINNNQSSAWINETAYKQQKANFLKLKNLVLIGGPDDGVITPWQSSHFGFYDQDLNVLDMTQQMVYLDDTFGLQTLDKRKAVHMYTFPGIEHVKWHGSEQVFDKAIKPWLT